MTPISPRRRGIYLALTMALVVIGAPILIFYAEGYRLEDLGDAFGVRGTGGVYVAAGQSGVSVSVGGVKEDTTSFLSRGVLVQNLSAGEYFVEASKPGYHPLAKSLPVYQSLVTEWRLLLLPNPTELQEIEQFLPAATSTAAVAPAPERNPEYALVAALFAPSTTTRANATSSIVAADADLAEALVETDRAALIKNDTLRRAGDLVAWIDRGSLRFAWLGDLDAAPQYLCSPEGCLAEVSIRLAGGVESFEFFPGREDAFVVTTGNGVYAVEADGRGGRAAIALAERGYEARVSADERLYLKLGRRVWEVAAR